MFILDCGMAFPDADMPGVDIVLPDFTYVEGNKDKVRGIVITHGHEDHIGGLAYLLKKVNVPVYGTRMTLGLIRGKLEEHGILKQAKLIEIEPRKTVKMGCMAVEFIKVNHSIPGAVGMAIHTRRASSCTPATSRWITLPLTARSSTSHGSANWAAAAFWH